MNAKDFIIKKLQCLTDVFKKARVRYEYDVVAEVHTVEVIPQSVYESQAFLEWESNLFDEFVAMYPHELLGFISEDAVVNINQVDYISEGIEYAPYNDTDKVQCIPDSILKVHFYNECVSPSTFTYNDEKEEFTFKQTVVSGGDIENFKLAA